MTEEEVVERAARAILRFEAFEGESRTEKFPGPTADEILLGALNGRKSRLGVPRGWGRLARKTIGRADDLRPGERRGRYGPVHLEREPSPGPEYQETAVGRFVRV